MKKLGDFLTIKQAAELSGYSERHIRKLWYSGKLEGMKIGNMVFLTDASLQSYLAIASEMAKKDGRYKGSTED